MLGLQVRSAYETLTRKRLNKNGIGSIHSKCENNTLVIFLGTFESLWLQNCLESLVMIDCFFCVVSFTYSNSYVNVTVRNHLLEHISCEKTQQVVVAACQSLEWYIQATTISAQKLHGCYSIFWSIMIMRSLTLISRYRAFLLERLKTYDYYIPYSTTTTVRNKHY